jgi:methylated-DNA-[protein]-cysteine S-methyltransferase
MAVPHYCLIETAFGRVGLAWSECGLLRLQLPASDEERTRQLLTRYLDGAEADPPDWLKPTIVRLQRYFAGEKVDLSDAPLDLDGKPEFMQRLYQEMLKLGWGETVTYGGLAERVGMPPGAAQAVGQAMGKNPIPIVIPCHRVLASGNMMGGFSAPGGTQTKLKLLELEGIRLGQHDPAQMGFGF